MRYQYLHNAFEVVSMFEKEVANYTGADYAVAVDSCTDALFLCCKYYNVDHVIIPSKTYLSVPQSIEHAGGRVVFDESLNNWKGMYQLKDYPIWDAAKRFTSGMYLPGQLMCLSFHIKKHLPIGKGGMILTDNYHVRDWLRKARYEGRGQLDYHIDTIPHTGWNMYMTPEQAARGLTLMMNVPMDNPDLEENEGYRDLREFDLYAE